MEDKEGYLDEEEQEEFKLLLKELNEETEEGASPVENKELKKRVAEFIFKIVDGIDEDEELIQKTCYIIAAFLQFEFKDELDEIAITAGELELPPEHVSGDLLEMFDEMKKMLEAYLS